MAFIILFSNLWGIYLKEWQGVSNKVYWLLATGLFFVVMSTVVIGFGNAVSMH